MKKSLLVLTAISTVLVGKSLSRNPSEVPFKDGSFLNYTLLHFQASLYKKELYRYKDSNGLPGAIIAIKKPYRPLWIGAAGN
jgi:hypothetical protein